ncbi:MAG: VOC family protein [Mongoliitalea sp.]
MKNILYCLLLSLLLSCQASTEKAKQLGHIHAFIEMVAADVKPIALSEPMEAQMVDELWEEVISMAEKAGVGVFREPDLIQTSLFPTSVSLGKEVLIFHKENSLAAYLNLKKSIPNLEPEAAARRFGRLLGYPTHYINQLLSTNTAYKSLPDFGIQATNIFLYYQDLQRAEDFYGQLLGLEKVSDYTFAKTFQLSLDAYLTIVDESIGRHKADEPKTVAIALLTDQLPEWYAYLLEKNVPIKYTYKPKTDNAHDGFVAIDPEGYLLEFETFKQHPENELLMPQLQKFGALKTFDPSVAAGLGFYGAVFWTYYEDLQEAELFYMEKIGLPLMVDQGWAKVFQASQTGYIGLVDERRGMHNFTEKKGSSIAFVVEDLEGWYAYVQEQNPFPLHREWYEDAEKRYEAFVGVDPGKYFMEFNRFIPHTQNEQLLKRLQWN